MAARNGKIMLDAPEININGVTANESCSVYNIFEGNQKTTGNSLKRFTAKNVNVNGVNLQHNVFNFYNPEDDAEITVKDSTFDLNVKNSNVMRLSNLKNSKNVKVTFENVNWTYETIGGTDADFEWAGLVLFQPFGKDLSYTGDNSAISTWTFTFKNCKYNGQKVTENDFKGHSQAIYFYDMNKSKKVSELTEEGLPKIIFE